MNSQTYSFDSSKADKYWSADKTELNNDKNKQILDILIKYVNLDLVNFLAERGDKN